MNPVSICRAARGEELEEREYLSCMYVGDEVGHFALRTSAVHPPHTEKTWEPRARLNFNFKSRKVQNAGTGLVNLELIS